MRGLPRKLYLTATGQHWRVSYVKKPGKITLIELPYRKLVICGKRYSRRAAVKLISRWVKMRSKAYLTALLFKLNRKIKANFSKIRIHSLKTEWGSCTSKREIGFNYKVIFLPPTLVRYIIIHELCHLGCLNHSARFWKKVAKFDKNWEKHKTAVSDADQHVPEWLIF